MATHREEQSQLYSEFCQKYGKNHTWDMLTDEDKNQMKVLTKLAQQEYRDAIRL